MDFRRISITILCIVCFLIPAIAQDDADPEGQGQPVHIIISLDGPAYVHRINWAVGVDQPLTLGAFVTSTDEIIPLPGTRVGIMCADFSIDIIESLSRSPDCVPEPTGSGPFHIFAGHGPTSRGTTDEVPYLISPSVTQIANPQPTLIWNPITNAIEYEVEVLLISTTGALVQVWSASYISSSAELAYPATEEPLEPGRYQVNIQPIDDEGPMQYTGDGDPGNYFTVVDAETAENIASDVTMIMNRPFPTFTPPGMVDYAVAVYMQNNNFSADALDLMTDIITSDGASSDLVNSPAPYLRLGEIYASIGLDAEATEAYETALAYAIAAETRLYEAQAREALANLNREITYQFCQLGAAQLIYAEIGDEAKSTELRDILVVQAGALDSRPDCPAILGT